MEAGGGVGRFQDQKYELGSTSAGLAWAIGRISQPRRELETEKVA
jgi:hypothetical protein